MGDNEMTAAQAGQEIRDMVQTMSGYTRAATNMSAFQNLMERGKATIYDPIKQGIQKVDNQIDTEVKVPKFKDVMDPLMPSIQNNPAQLQKYQSVYRKYLEAIGGIDTNPVVFDAYLASNPRNFRIFANRLSNDEQRLPGLTLSQRLREYMTDEIKNFERHQFKVFTDANGTSLDSKVGPSKPVPGSFILRARYPIAEGTDVEETKEEQVRDAVMGDMFSFVQPNAEEGYKNSLFLDNRLNDALRYAGSDVKAFEKFPNGLGFDSSLYVQQYEPVAEGLMEIAVDAMTIAPLQSKEVSGFGVLPGSNIISEEPFTQIVKSSFMIPGEIQPANFSRDNFSQPLAADFNNMIGMKPYYDQYRHPFNPSFQPTAIMNPRTQIMQSLIIGPQIY
jgi:hypothetical protein